MDVWFNQHVAKLFGIKHFNDIFHLLVSDVSVVISVNLPDSSHYLSKFDLISKDFLKLIEGHFV